MDIKVNGVNKYYIDRYIIKAGVLSLLLLFTLFMHGCAAVATGEKFALTQPAQDKVIIYHYRESAIKASAFSYDVLSNRKPMTRMGNGGYFREVTTPGTIEYRTLLSSNKGPIFFLDNLAANWFQEYEEAYSFKAEKGKIYFLRWSPKVFGGPPEIEMVDKNEAMDEITELRSYPPALVEQPTMRQ